MGWGIVSREACGPPRSWIACRSAIATARRRLFLLDLRVKKPGYPGKFSRREGAKGQPKARTVAVGAALRRNHVQQPARGCETASRLLLGRGMAWFLHRCGKRLPPTAVAHLPLQRQRLAVRLVVWFAQRTEAFLWGMFGRPQGRPDHPHGGALWLQTCPPRAGAYTNGKTALSSGTDG